MCVGGPTKEHAAKPQLHLFVWVNLYRAERKGNHVPCKPKQTTRQKNTSREREHQDESSGKQLERQGMARMLCCSPPVGDDTAVSLPLLLHSFVREDKSLRHVSQKVQRNLRASCIGAPSRLLDQHGKRSSRQMMDRIYKKATSRLTVSQARWPLRPSSGASSHHILTLSATRKQMFL